tara:strand:+ start:61 stop:492 length:432 start_codon:yes stop_codon:yes gene_type:complete
MEQKQIDLRYGFKSEKEIHSYLEKTFGELKDTKDKFGKHFEFDKYNEKYFIEIKTRRINHRQYPTLMFGKNKYLKGEELLKKNPKLRIFYLWRCYDGVYYWEHNSSEYTEQISGRRDRGCIEESMCIHIATEYINHIDNLELC